MKVKWKNWWWYHWWHVLLVAVVAGIVLYSFLPGLLRPKDDYSIAIISVGGISEKTAAELTKRIISVSDDANGDGRVNIRMNQFTVDLSGDANAANYQETARLDADLVGKVSSIFFIEDPVAFRANTAVPVQPGELCSEIMLFEDLELPEGMLFTIRSDSDDPAIFSLYGSILSDSEWS